MILQQSRKNLLHRTGIRGGRLLVFLPLGKGREATIDAADWALVQGFKWYAMKAPQKQERFYAAGWKNMPPGRFFVHLHRLIADAKPGELIDHADRNPLNCCRDNLRRATHAENARNRSTSTGKSVTSYKLDGCRFQRGRPRW